MFEYIPKLKKTKEKAAVAIAIVLAVTSYILSGIPVIPFPAFYQLFAVVCLVLVVIVTGKSLLRSYSYLVEQTEDGKTDFSVKEVYGRKISTVCRISLTDIIDIVPMTASNKKEIKELKKGKVVYHYTGCFFPVESYFLTVREENQTILLEICANSEFIEILKKR